MIPLITHSCPLLVHFVWKNEPNSITQVLYTESSSMPTLNLATLNSSHLQTSIMFLPDAYWNCTEWIDSFICCFRTHIMLLLILWPTTAGTYCLMKNIVLNFLSSATTFKPCCSWVIAQTDVQTGSTEVCFLLYMLGIVRDWNLVPLLSNTGWEQRLCLF